MTGTLIRRLQYLLKRCLKLGSLEQTVGPVELQLTENVGDFGALRGSLLNLFDDFVFLTLAADHGQVEHLAVRRGGLVVPHVRLPIVIEHYQFLLLLILWALLLFDQ